LIYAAAMPDDIYDAVYAIYFLLYFSPFSPYQIMTLRRLHYAF